VLLLLGGGGLVGYLRWSAPYRAALRFAQAVERRDARALYRGSDPVERHSLKLTEAGVQRYLHAFLDGDYQAVRLEFRPEPQPTGPRDWIGPITWQQWKVTWQRRPGSPRRPAADERPLPDRFETSITVRRSEEGWRVLTSPFFAAVAERRLGRPGGIRAWARIAREVGLKGLVQDQGWYYPIELFQPGNRLTIRDLVRPKQEG